jgi:PAS domain S-box-containing protein
MRLFQNTSIRRKQMLIMMLITSVALILACAMFAAFEMVNFRKEMVQNLTTLARIVGYNTAAALDFNDAQTANEALLALKSQPHIISACVYSRNGEIFAVYKRPNYGVTFIPLPKPERSGYSFAGDRLALFEPITAKGDVIGMIYLESDMKGLQSKLAQFALITSLVLLLTLLVAFLLSARLQRLISEPILDLVRIVRAVAQDKNYSIRVAQRGTDEIGVLIDRFNEMLSQIQQRDAALQSARDGLEVRVAERTDELAKSNKALLIENTERKKADESLREAEAKYRGLFENAIEGIYQSTPDGRYLAVNAALARIYGYERPEEMTGDITDIQTQIYLDPSLRERFKKEIDFAGVVRGLEYQVRRRDGSALWISESARAVRRPDGAVSHYEGFVEDISQRKRIETKLLQSQKLETVGKLAGGIAHEFNSILTAIIGQSELLLSDLPEESPLLKNASEISQAAGRAATLTRQLLAYGRKQILQPEILDLNRAIANMEGMLHNLMGGDVKTRIVPAPGLHAVKVDAGQVQQVIVNMALNAREAMPNGGQLTLETANVSFDEDSVGRYLDMKPGEYVVVAITDTGAGMTEEVKTRLFEPFFSTKGVGQGTGLGLSTCYGIVKQTGGHINVYSEPGRGSTFKVYLPRADPEPKIPVQRLAAPDLPRGTETILLVEDDPALREMAGTLLKRLGYKVWAAANGVEALSLKQERGISYVDLLFTDVVMPHMSGKELADRVRVLYPHTKILFTSAYTENAIVDQGVLNKGVALLQKPFTPSALARKVREVLDQARTPDSEMVGFAKITTGENTP